LSGLLVAAGVTCPWCGEPVTLLVDRTAGDQTYVEDCPVCCHPMDVVVSADGDPGDPTGEVQTRRAQ